MPIRDIFFTRYFRVFIIIFLGIILGGGWFFFLEPKIEILKIGLTNLKKQKEVLNSRSNRLEELKKITKDYEKIEEEKIKRIYSILPSEEDLPGIFVQMEALAKESKFILRSIEIRRQKKGEEEVEREGGFLKGIDIKELRISLKLEKGSYERFKEFLDKVEKNLRILEVVFVNFDPKGASFGVDLKTYYLTES